MSVRAERHGTWAEIVLADGAAGNPLNLDSVARLRDAIATVVKEEPPAVLLRAEGKNFCVGGDLRAVAGAGSDAGEFIGRLADAAHEALQALQAVDVPVVVAANGAIAGAGVGLALSGDLLVASRSTRFVMAYTASGITPDCGGTYFLPRLVGIQRALDLALTNRALPAEEALSWGLVSRVVDDAELLTAARELTGQLAGGHTQALIDTKRLVRRGAVDAVDLADQHAAESAAIRLSVGRSETQAAIHAFVNRKKA